MINFRKNSVKCFRSYGSLKICQQDNLEKYLSKGLKLGQIKGDDD